MLEITKGEKTVLPEKYHEVNNILAHLYDLLTEICSDEYYLKLKSTEISFNGNEGLRVDLSDKTQNALDSLKKNGKNIELEEFLTKHLVIRVLTDILNFIYEAINTAKKGKMSVAYALLRKPFTDELLILEQLLANKEDFLKRFFHDGNVKGYDPSDRSIDILKIIEASIESLNFNGTYTADLIYKLRYDKSIAGGINGITNQALHIVTTDPNYRTENQNLNFVFSNIEDTNCQWEHFYFAVPILLMYTSAVADKIVFQYLDDTENRLTFKNLKRLLAYFNIYTKSRPSYQEQFYKELSDSVLKECPCCTNLNKFIEADFKLFFYAGIFLCSKCFNVLTFDKLDLDKLNKMMFSLPHE